MDNFTSDEEFGLRARSYVHSHHALTERKMDEIRSIINRLSS